MQSTVASEALADDAVASEALADDVTDCKGRNRKNIRTNIAIYNGALSFNPLMAHFAQQK